MSTRRDSTTDKRQKNQYGLAFLEESRGAAPMAFEGGTESELAKRRAESPTSEQWMEEVCERENCKQALRRVKANKGSPGIDGMTVEELSGHRRFPNATIQLSPCLRCIVSVRVRFQNHWTRRFGNCT
jgi:hypothetical protein